MYAIHIRELVQALMIPTHVDHPFISAFGDVSWVRVRNISSPFDSTRDITSFDLRGKECPAGRIEEAPAMRVSHVQTIVKGLRFAMMVALSRGCEDAAGIIILLLQGAHEVYMSTTSSARVPVLFLIRSSF